jgi:hypothetical protein
VSLVSISASDLNLQFPRSRLPAAARSILEAWDTDPLSPLAERTLRMIASQYTRKGFCHATHEQLACSLGAVKSTLQRGVDELEADGILVITRRPRTSNLTFLAEGVKEALRVQHLERVRERKKRVKSRLSFSKRGKNRPKAEPTAQPKSPSRIRHISTKSNVASKQRHHRTDGDAFACFNEKQRATTEQLIAIGITSSQAILIVRKYTLERIEKHLQAQRYLMAKNPPGYLVAAIRNDYQELVFTDEGSGTDTAQAPSQAHCLTESGSRDVMASTGIEEQLSNNTAQKSSQVEFLTESEVWDVLELTGAEECSEPDDTPALSQAEYFAAAEACEVIHPPSTEERPQPIFRALATISLEAREYFRKGLRLLGLSGRESAASADVAQTSRQAESLMESEAWELLEPASIEECPEADTIQAASRAESFAKSETESVVQAPPTVSSNTIDRAAGSGTRDQAGTPTVSGFVPLGLSLAALNASFLANGRRSSAGAARAQGEAEWCLTESERRELAQASSAVITNANDRALASSTIHQASTPVVAELVALGVQPAIAALTASTYSEERIRRQLKLGKHLTAKNPAAFIMAAIRRDYAIDQPVPGSEHEAAFHREQQERLAQKHASVASTVPKRIPSTVPPPPIPPSPFEILRAKFDTLSEQEHAKFLSAARENLIKSPPPYIAHLIARGDFQNPLLAGTVRTRAMKIWESSA